MGTVKLAGSQCPVFCTRQCVCECLQTQMYMVAFKGLRLNLRPWEYLKFGT